MHSLTGKPIPILISEQQTVCYSVLEYKCRVPTRLQGKEKDRHAAYSRPLCIQVQYNVPSHARTSTYHHVCISTVVFAFVWRQHQPIQLGTSGPSPTTARPTFMAPRQHHRPRQSIPPTSKIRSYSYPRRTRFLCRRSRRLPQPWRL